MPLELTLEMGGAVSARLEGMILAESLLHALRAHGARQIFGIPGDFALPFFGVVEESGILPLHLLSHEPSVGFAAGVKRLGAG